MTGKNAKRDTVAFFAHQRSGCWWYRIEHVIKGLEKAGVKTVLFDMNTDIEEGVYDKIMSVQLYGAYPFSFEPVLKQFKANGVKIVYDTDDALELVEPTNPFYHSVMKDVGSVDQILAYADEVTVSTPQMAEFIKGKYSGKITVVPNCYLPSEWTYPRPQRDGIRIGFAGAAPHVSDLIEIIPTIKKLQDKYNVKFLIMGFGQETYETWYKQYRYIAQPEATKELRKLDALLSEIVFEWIPFVDYTLYPSVLTNLALDIGICPLKPTPFNNHRSAVKALEYTMSGALALASDTIPYREDNNSILVKDWDSTLDAIVGMKILGESFPKEHLVWTQKNRNLEDKLDLLKSVYVV